jgi:hypothetical protein
VHRIEGLEGVLDVLPQVNVAFNGTNGLMQTEQMAF